MNTEYTDLELQRWLAKQLPKEIQTIDHGHQTYFKWIFGDWVKCVQVTPREWLHVVSLVEEKLTRPQCVYYTQILHTQNPVERSCALQDFGCIHASWQLRTIAISQTLNIPIRDQVIGDQ